MDLELDLANLIKAISFAEINIENMRIKLAENPNFDIDYIFSEQKETGLITSQDIMDFMSVYRIALSPRECEYLMNLNSKAINEMDFESLYKTILPKTDKSLFLQVLNRAKNKKNRTYNQHFSSETVLQSVSERETARIFEQELFFYRTIEKLKKEFQSTHSITISELFKIIDYKSKGYLDYESIHNYMTKLKVLFNKNEFWALLRRIAVNLDTKIEYQELIYAIFPKEPYEYPAFRGKFKREDPLEKAREFGYVEPNEIIDFEKNRRPLTFIKNQRPLLNFIKNPLETKRKNFIYDKNYHKEYHHYKAKFIQPSKDLSYSYKNATSGVRSLNDFFEDYYYFLSDREKSEDFFNKYGKRYNYENELDSVRKNKLDFGEKTLIDTFRYTLEHFNVYND